MVFCMCLLSRRPGAHKIYTADLVHTKCDGRMMLTYMSRHHHEYTATEHVGTWTKALSRNPKVAGQVLCSVKVGVVASDEEFYRHQQILHNDVVGCRL